MNFTSVLIALFASVAICVAVPAADELRIDDAMARDPVLDTLEINWVFDPRLKELWEQALRRPESELQRLAADTIAIAHRQGMSGLNLVVGDLIKTIQRPETSANVRRAATHALVALDAKQHGPLLAQVSAQYGLDLQAVVEPALARWKDESLRDAWRGRLSDERILPRLRMLAIDGLGALRDSNSKPSLLKLVLNPRIPENQRLAAAQALAAIGNGGMLEDARRLLADKTPAGIPNRLLAVQLISADRDTSALDMLVELANDPEPSVASAALNRVFEIDPPRLFPLAPQASKHSDVNIRQVGVRALLLLADIPSIETMTPLLDDPNPSLRRSVAKGMFDLAQKPALRQAVIIAAEHASNSDSWRALEQGALLVGHLDHKPAATRMVELLKHRRHEVAVSSAWALRQFKVPETFPAVLAHAQSQHQRHLTPETPFHERVVIYSQDSQLFQMFGEIRMVEADPLLRQYIPKALGLGDARPAACWGLGKIHEGKAPADLAALFAGRVADVNSMPPEIDSVRLMCAVGLGRMKAESELPTLRRFSREGSQVAVACWWSIHLLTGEIPPKIERGNFQVMGWFLERSD
jgi:HEAT repeat protein